jgi:hypothetical protein
MDLRHPAAIDGPEESDAVTMHQGAIATAADIVIPSGPIVLRDRTMIGRLLLERRIPSIGAFREIVEAGAVMSYGIDLVGLFRSGTPGRGHLLHGEDGNCQ